MPSTPRTDHLREMEKATKTKVMVLAERAKPQGDSHPPPRGLGQEGESVKPGRPRKPRLSARGGGEIQARPGPLARVGSRPTHRAVTVNRLWQMLFGVGLGTHPRGFRPPRGTAYPTPELLDWLAVEFMESGWGRAPHAPPDGHERHLPPRIRGFGASARDRPRGTGGWPEAPGSAYRAG